MKILYIVFSFYPSIGGTETYAYSFSKYLVDNGNEVTICSTDYTTTKCCSVIKTFFPFIQKKGDIRLEKHENYNNIDIIRFPCLLKLWSFHLSPEMIFFLKNHVNEFRIVHAYGYHVFSSVVACYFAKGYKKPFILTGIDLTVPSNLPNSALFLKKIYDMTIGRWLLNNSSLLIALTNDQIQEYLRYGVKKEKILLIPPSINLKNYTTNYYSAGDLNKKYNIKNDEVIILFVGRLEEYKGVQDIIKILPQIIKKYNALKFFVVGKDHGYKQNLVELITKEKLENYVYFTDSIPQNDLISLYQISDFFVLPSINEGFGIVLLEAMATKALCIAYSIPTIRCVIENNITGVLVNDKSEIPKVIEYYLDNPDKKNVIINNAFNYVKRYDIEYLSQEIHSIYSNL